MKRFVFLSLSLLLLILIPGCFTFQTPAPNPVPPVGQPSVIREFSNNPSTINSGGTSTLLWNVTGANSVSIDQGIGLVDVAGTRIISPITSTVYTISATNSAGTVTRSSLTTVNSAPPLPSPPQTTASNPVISFTATYIGGTANNSTQWQLNWNVSNATQIAIEPDIGTLNQNFNPQGSHMVTIPSGQTKTYRLKAINNWGWAYWDVVLMSP